MLDFSAGIFPPEPEEELRWFIEELVTLLAGISLDLEKESGAKNKMLRAEAERICWALAVLLKDPPVEDVDSEQVKKWIEDAGRNVKDELITTIETYYAKL